MKEEGSNRKDFLSNLIYGKLILNSKLYTHFVFTFI